MKPFRYKNRPPVERQVEIIKELAKHYGIIVRWCKDADDGRSGYHAVRKGKRGIYQHIGIIKNPEYKNKLSTFFHELGHCHCYNNKIWRAYHERTFRKNRPIFYTPQIKKIIHTGFKAERWVDRWAEKEMAKWFPNLKYVHGYDEPEDKKWFHKEYLPFFKRKLKKRCNSI